ncbi:MAG: hypothetical protein PHQ66_02800 [Candidatus Nanoarchaeia archaeon]|nr:hypothetical protein [Candidatus Nanoarchaeia archaeon]MDD5357706.1 hypothetical protein [Candidatus Nanoarchaeia archaeon]MDD5588625.1 hypothetical protein [Candidatus Nanoarchaeia archaeon]
MTNKKGLQILALSGFLLGSAKLPADESIPNPVPVYKPLSEKIISNGILNPKQNVSFKGVGYAGVGISVNSMIKSFLPYLNKPTFNIDSGFELRLTPDLSLKAECNPFNHIYFESQNNSIGFGIYLRFPLNY